MVRYRMVIWAVQCTCFFNSSGFSMAARPLTFKHPQNIWAKIYIITLNQVWHAGNKYQQYSQTVSILRYLLFFKCKITTCLQILFFENEFLTYHLWIKHLFHNSEFSQWPRALTSVQTKDINISCRTCLSIIVK